MLAPCESEALALINGTAEVWDVEGLTSWSQLGRPVRVVRELKKCIKRERVAKQWVKREVSEDWRWMVVVPDAQQPPADLIRCWGRARWDEETRGFGELTKHWHLNHCYHPHPVAMLAIRLILYLALFLTTPFFQRNLKPAISAGKTRLHLAGLLADGLVRGGGSSF